MTTTASTQGRAAAEVNGRPAVGVLSYLGFTVLLLQVGIVPMLPAIGRHFQLAPGDVAWVLTAELLAGAVGLAVLTRLADMFGKRRIIIVCLALTLAGALLGALTESLAMLLVARALMGAQTPMLALPEAIAGDTMTPSRARWTVTTIHAGNSVGVAGGLLLGGLVGTFGHDYRLYFWVAAGTVAIALAGTVLFVGESPYRAPGGFDLPGGLLLAAGLVSLLLGISKGPAWGWRSPEVIGLIAGGLLIAGVWFLVERRTPYPLVDLAAVLRPATRVPNIAVFLIAFGIYGAISAVTRFAQTDPDVAGYGFGYSPLRTCLFAIPVAAGGIVAALTLRPIGRRAGYAGATAVSVAFCTAAYLILTVAHASPGPMMASLAIYALGNTMGIAAAQIIVLRSVPPAQSGVALGVMIILYAIGNSLGSTIVGMILAGDRVAGTPLPAAGAYATSFLVCGACTALAGALMWYARRTTRPAEHPT